MGILCREREVVSLGNGAMTKALFVPTVLTFVAIWAVSFVLVPGSTFITTKGQQLSTGHGLASQDGHSKESSFISEPVTRLRQSVGTSGVFAYGLGFGLLAAFARSASGVARKAEGEEGLAVAEKKETKEDSAASLATRDKAYIAARAELGDYDWKTVWGKTYNGDADGLPWEMGAPLTVKQQEYKDAIPYLASMPRALFEKRNVDALLKATPPEEWEDPPEASPLWIMKTYAETYGEGPGKSTKMAWWDYFQKEINTIPAAALDEVPYELEELYWYNRVDMAKRGVVPLMFPGPAGWYGLGGNMETKFRAKEYFAGEVQTVITNSGFTRQFVGNWPFYRPGLQNWQRGIEVGMAHGYFIIGPFVALGPAAPTPQGATIGLLCGCAIIGITAMGSLLFGATEKPRCFDKEGDAPGAGWQEFTNWFAVGGLGGAGFAHLLLTVFGTHEYPFTAAYNPVEYGNAVLPPGMMTNL